MFFVIIQYKNMVDKSRTLNYNIKADVLSRIRVMRTGARGHARCCMKLNLREIIEIPGSGTDFVCDLSTEDLDFPSIVRYLSVPHAEGRVFNEAGILRLEGEIRAKLLCICDRCGEEFESIKETELNAVLVEENTGDDPELFVLQDDGIDLDELLSTLFVLDMETKFLCREDCKGLCPTCGKNLNLGPCGCRKTIDPRFAVLEQLLDKKA